jgi:hypothetical protein
MSTDTSTIEESTVIKEPSKPKDGRVWARAWRERGETGENSMAKSECVGGAVACDGSGEENIACQFEYFVVE